MGRTSSKYWYFTRIKQQTCEIILRNRMSQYKCTNSNVKHQGHVLCCMVALQWGVVLPIDRSQVQFQAGPFSRNIVQLSLASLCVAKSSTWFGWGKVGILITAGWQVTLCVPIWIWVSRSSKAKLLLTAIHTLLYFTILCWVRRKSWTQY